jgi:site-specific recombinase XerD
LLSRRLNPSDFCNIGDTYQFDDAIPSSLPHFIEKLNEKRQTEASQMQAHSAIQLYYTILQSPSTKTERNSYIKDESYETAKEPIPSYSTAVTNNELSKPDPNTFNDSNEKWKSALVTVANEIRVRHYSPKTLKAYTLWAHKIRAFLKNKDPDQLSTDDVKSFLTHLAVDQHVSASSQNQAFNALLFFFRHALKKEFGKVDGVVRAKRRHYIPVVLSRSEIDAIILNLQYPVSLVVKLLYGCGLRLFECLNPNVA